VLVDELDSVVDMELDAVADADKLKSVEVFIEDEEPLDDPLFVESTANLHRRTSSTAGLPSLSVIGVKVMTQVSVIGPTGVMVLCIVVTVVESARLLIGTACTAPKKLERQESRTREARNNGRVMVNIASCCEEGLKDNEEPGSCGISTMCGTMSVLRKRNKGQEVPSGRFSFKKQD